MLRLKGNYEIYEGGTIQGNKVINGKLVYSFHNIICTPVYNQLLNSLNGDALADIEASYFAFGTGTTAVTEGDTTLTTEVFRKIPTSKSWTGKVFTAIVQLALAEANYSLTEVGLFAGGSINADSGTLLSHALKTITKNSNITYNVLYTLTMEEN